MGKLFFIVVVYGIPVCALLYSLIKKMLLPFLLGVAAFTISQILIRIPLLEMLSSYSIGYQLLAVTQPLLFYFLLALTAGLFEETARFIAMKWLMKKCTIMNGIVFGFGHGMIEAILIVGIPILLQPTLSDTQLFYSGLERLLAMIMHVCFSLFVLLAIRKRNMMYYAFAIALHTMINFLVVVMAQQLDMAIVEGMLAGCTMILLGITYCTIRRKWNEKS